MESILIIAYMIWAIYIGWRFMDGRVKMLEQEGVGYKVVKFLCAYLVGGVFGVFLLVYWFFRLARNLMN